MLVKGYCMNKQDISVLMAQINPIVGAIEHNAAQIINILKSHSEDLIIFPELVLTGYPPEDLLLRPELYLRVRKALDQIAAYSKNNYVIVGHPIDEAGLFFNAASIFHKGSLHQRYFKQHLPNYGVFDEKRYFAAGPKERCVIELKNQRFGICICEDLWQSGPVEDLVAEGIDALISINASPFENQKMTQRMAILKERAALGFPIFYTNLLGGQDELVFDGQSLVVNKHGQICAKAPAFSEALLSVSFDGEEISGPISETSSEMAILYQALCFATRDYVTKNHFKGVLLGLSGGIDSALTLCIAVDALGHEQVEAVLMPSRYTADMSVDDAKAQAEIMGVRNYLIPIEPAFNCMLNLLAPAFASKPVDTTEENLQARIRGLLLMSISNKHGKMLLTTSNKSETAVGYATLYGDMAGGYAPLKDVLKTQVYELAAYRNSISAVIPARVIERAPSAELAENQTDQDSLPDYPTLDAIIKLYMEENASLDTIVACGFPRVLVARVLQLIKRNEYKRRQAAPGAKVSSRAFDRDWRYPITAQF